jgi:hypothetical protein
MRADPRLAARPGLTVYRDDPLDDEAELRAIVGDDHVDRLGSTPGALETALDVLRVLQGWADDGAIGQWLSRSQRRLGGASPLDALVDARFDEVEDAARAWAAANG